MEPVLQALVVADHVYQDVTGKKIIAGTFNTFKFSRKPAIKKVQTAEGVEQTQVMGGMDIGSPSAYVNLTDVCDGTQVQLQFVNLTKNMVLFTTSATIKNPNRLCPVELVFHLPRLPIQETGAYALELVCEGKILGSYRITAVNLDDEQKDPS